MENNERINKNYGEAERGMQTDGQGTVIDKRTDGAFIKAAEVLHKKHSELNRTFTLPFLLMLACVVVAAFALRQFIAEPTMVDGPSMETTLMDTERVLVEKVSYWLHEPRRGDIVIVKYPDRWERFVKRVIALPGETIEIRPDGFVYINDEKLDESAYAGDWYGRVYKKVETVGSVDGKYTVPEGHYFVVGDNRNLSHDSRDDDVGPISAVDVLGRVRAVIWPINKLRSVSK